jgi:hypothetical protein
MLRRLLLVCLFASSALAGGCVGPSIQPRQEALKGMTEIVIVPMEAPPLYIGPGYATSGSASIVHFLPRYTIGMARAVGVLSGIAVLLDLSALSHRQMDYPPLAQPAGDWIPSVELAAEAARLLSATGKVARISPEIQSIPGVGERGMTFSMENWMAPIRSWYNDERPSMRYAPLSAGQVSTVVELGVSNYEIHAGRLLLQVHVKLFDPASGKVIGRARASSFTELPSMDEVFAADAKRLKQSIARAGNELVLSCLQELGVVPK